MQRRTYPVAACDRHHATRTHGPQTQFRAIAIGTVRPPRAGEWYLSGAIVEAYRAPSDLTASFMIARLVKCERVRGWKIVDTLNPGE